MKLSIPKGQSRCLQLLICIIFFLSIRQFEIPILHIAIMLVACPAAYLCVMWIRCHTWKPQPPSNSYQISQSASIVLPEGWSLRLTDTHAYLDHGYTNKSHRIFIGSLSTRQIHDAIHSKLNSIYHD